MTVWSVLLFEADGILQSPLGLERSQKWMRERVSLRNLEEDMKSIQVQVPGCCFGLPSSEVRAINEGGFAPFYTGSTRVLCIVSNFPAFKRMREL